MLGSRVFISYSHDSADHREWVLELAERLRDDGIDAWIDQYEPSTPALGWPDWMIDQLDVADSVIVVATEIYYRRFRGREAPGRGKGVAWESCLIKNELYQERCETKKFLCVLRREEDASFIPEALRGRNRHVLASEEAYQALYGELLHQGGVEPRELGVLDPGERRRGEPLRFPTAEDGAAVVSTSPFVLPPLSTEGFVGRHDELQLVADALINGPDTVDGRCAGIYGPPGAGKSGLARHFAQTHRGRFPGGVIGVDLRGIDDPMDVLAQLAAALGEPLTEHDQSLPAHHIAQRLLAHLRCLVLLDNMEHGAALKQLRSGGRAALLITCRNQDVLKQFAVPARYRLPLSRLPRAASIEYLRSAIGDTHAEAELDPLAAALEDLPLALRIGARRLQEDPLHNDRIQRFLAKLSVPAGLMELNIHGEEELELLPLFELSLESLNQDQRRAFACLGVCAGGGFGLRAAAAATALEDPRSLLGRLARLSLLEVDQTSGRFRFHALVDDFARLLAHHWGVADEARQRHAEAMAALLRLHANAAGEELAAIVADQDDIRHGLEHYADAGRIDLPLLQGLARLVEQTALGAWHSRLLERLQERIDPDDQRWMRAVLLLQQGKRQMALGHLEEAHEAFNSSLLIKQRLGDQRGEGMVLNSLGGVLRDLNRPDEACGVFERSLEIARRGSDERSEGMVLNSLGGVLRDLRRLAEARNAFERSLEIARSLSESRSEAMVLNGLGGVLRDLNLPEEAREALECSLGISRRLLDARSERMVLNSLGGVLRDLKCLDEARQALDHSLAISRSLSDARGEAMVLNNLGWLHRELGEPTLAIGCLERHRAIRRRLSLGLPSFLKDELKMLRKWSKRLRAGTHALADYHLAMGKRRYHAKDWFGAIIHFGRNLELDRDSVDLGARTERLGSAYFRVGNWSETVDTYRVAESFAPLSAFGHATLGRALHLSGDLEEAARHLRQACASAKDNPWAHSWLGLVLAEVGTLGAAEESARRALSGEERHAVLWHNLAQVLARHPDNRVEKLHEALDICERASASEVIPWSQELAAELRRRLGLPSGAAKGSVRG